MRVLITETNASLILRARQPLGGIKAATLLLFAICLCSCLPERFRHEKYDCSGSLPTINTIIISKAKPGNYAKIVSPTSETEANITQLDEKTVWITYKNVQMKINRKNGAVTMVQGTKYIKIGCEKTVFTM